VKFRIKRRVKGAKVRTVGGKKLLKILRRHPAVHFDVVPVRPEIPPRERIVRVALSQVGVTEHPPNSNTGTRVKEYQAATTLGGTGWPYCQAGVVWVLLHAHVKAIYRGASVKAHEEEAKRLGRWHKTPKRGDAVVFEFDGNAATGDHVGIVRKVNTRAKTIDTIEFNTSPTATGSQANGGGVYAKTRPLSLCKGFIDLVGDRS